MHNFLKFLIFFVILRINIVFFNIVADIVHRNLRKLNIFDGAKRERHRNFVHLRMGSHAFYSDTYMYRVENIRHPKFVQKYTSDKSRTYEKTRGARKCRT